MFPAVQAALERMKGKVMHKDQHLRVTAVAADGITFEGIEHLWRVGAAPHGHEAYEKLEAGDLVTVTKDPNPRTTTGASINPKAFMAKMRSCGCEVSIIRD